MLNRVLVLAKNLLNRVFLVHKIPSAAKNLLNRVYLLNRGLLNRVSTVLLKMKQTLVHSSKKLGFWISVRYGKTGDENTTTFE